MDKTVAGADAADGPAKIDHDQHGSLADFLDASFRRYAANPAFACMDRFLTYGELDDMSRRLAAWLQSRGMEKGARVAVMLPNVLQYPVALAAILRAGFVVVNVDPLGTNTDIERQLRDAGCEAVIILENHGHALEQMLPRTTVRHVVVASMGELLGGHGIMVDFLVRHVKRLVPEFSIPHMVRFRAALAQGARMPYEPPQAQPADVAFVQAADASAGTTANTKLTHQDAIASVLRLDAWARPMLEQPPRVPFPTIVGALPLHRVQGLYACALWGMRTGALSLLIPDPRDTKEMIQELARYPFHVVPGVNTLFDALVRDPAFQHLDFATLKVCFASGASVEPAVGDKWLALTGSRIVPEPFALDGAGDDAARGIMNEHL